jgi:hypothetical protein
MKTFIIFIFTVLVCSCLNKHTNNEEETYYITGFRGITRDTPNPTGAAFYIHTNSKPLREILLSEKWDRIRFSGGLLDTAQYNEYTLGVGETDVQSELIMGMWFYSFDYYTQNEIDSIASVAFDDLEIDIYYNEDHWKLKPLEKDAE